MSRIIFRKALLSLHFLQNPSLKSFTKSSSTTPSNLSFTAQYLINSCGLVPETAVLASQKLHLDRNNLHRHNSVISFFESLGFSKTQIAQLIAKRPVILNCRVQGNLEPKIEFLHSIGFSGSCLYELVLYNPVIFNRSLPNHLKPSIDFLMEFVKTAENVVSAIKRSKWLLTYDLKRTMQPNVALLISHGVPISNISRLVMTHPRSMMQNVNRMVTIIDSVKRVGFKPESSMFVHAVRAMTAISESKWNTKLEVFRSYGWSDEEIMNAFKQLPFVMLCSEEKIKSKMGFYVKIAKLKPFVVIMKPKLLMYGLDTRIQPRYRVLKALKKNEILKKDKSFISVLLLNEKRFLNSYVTKYTDRVPNLMEIYLQTKNVDGSSVKVSRKCR